MKALIKTTVVGPFQCNCRLLVCPKTGDAALVDPGDDAPKIIKLIEQTQKEFAKPIQLKMLLHTHAHLDHVGATRGVSEYYKQQPQIALHQGDEFIYQMLQKQGEMFGIKYDAPLPITKYLQDEETLKIGSLKLQVIHTPGHSPGSVGFRLHEDSATQTKESLFSGDTLFAGSVGRTDLWGADGDQMFRSIKTRMLTLDDDTLVCPGHGPDSKIGIEKRSNPFLT